MVDGKPQAFKDWSRLEFLQRVERDEAEILEKLIHASDGCMETVVASTPLPIYLWIQDRTEAIFAFPTRQRATWTPGQTSVANAFLTKDQDIVDTLIFMFDRVTGAVEKSNNRKSGRSLPAQVSIRD